MSSLVQPDRYGAINTSDTTTNVYYVINFISEAYTLKKTVTIEGQIITAGELFVKAQYIFSMKENTNWYWEQHTLKQDIIVPTRTIIHQSIDVAGIKYV